MIIAFIENIGFLFLKFLIDALKKTRKINFILILFAKLSEAFGKCLKGSESIIIIEERTKIN